MNNRVFMRRRKTEEKSEKEAFNVIEIANVLTVHNECTC